jgi:hypothetical protein
MMKVYIKGERRINVSSLNCLSFTSGDTRLQHAVIYNVSVALTNLRWFAAKKRYDVTAGRSSPGYRHHRFGAGPRRRPTAKFLAARSSNESDFATILA